MPGANLHFFFLSLMASHSLFKAHVLLVYQTLPFLKEVLRLSLNYSHYRCVDQLQNGWTNQPFMIRSSFFGLPKSALTLMYCVI